MASSRTNCAHCSRSPTASRSRRRSRSVGPKAAMARCDADPCPSWSTRSPEADQPRSRWIHPARATPPPGRRDRPVVSVVIEDRDAVRVLRIDRPERDNALDAATDAALGRALLDAEADDDVRAIVVTGTGDRSFCAGMDLRAFAESGAAGGPR